MNANNGHSSHPFLETQIDALRSGMHRLVERITVDEKGQPSRLRMLPSRTAERIKAHPIAAAATAFGLGYVVTRLLRRKP